MHRKPCDLLRKGFPVVGWIGTYDLEKAFADLIAGITVGLTLIPQSMAYATLAGLEPQYGLYSSLCGGLAYAIFGTVPEVSIGPTALLALLTFSYTNNIEYGNVPAAVLLCFFAGIIELCCGLLHLGFLVDFVSTPVVSGLTSAAAILIASAQVKNLLGLHYNAEKFIDIWRNVLEHIPKTNIYDASLSLCCCILLLTLRKLKDFGSPPVSNDKVKRNERYRIAKVSLWFMSVGRHAFVVIGSAVLAYLWTDDLKHTFTLSGKVPSGLPNFSLPPFQATVDNRTYTFTEMTKELGTGLIVLPFIAILANVAVAKSFSQGKVLDASQEMTAVGICNLVGSFFNSMPMNASFSRAAVNNASGVRTPFGGIYTGIMVLLSLTFLTPYFSFIPKATLASVIICAVIFMVEIKKSKTIWKLRKIDAVPMVITFCACLFLGIELGILIGVAVDLLLLLFHLARPKIDIQRVCIEGNEYLKITPSSSIYYPSAEYIRERILKNDCLLEKGKAGRAVIIDCSKISKTDVTAAKCLGSLAEDLGKAGKSIAFLKLDPHISKMFTKTCRNCIIAFTDDALAEMLRERRNSDIINSYKSIQITNGNTPTIFETVETKL